MGVSKILKHLKLNYILKQYLMAWSKYRTICDIGLVIKDQIIKKKAFKDKKSVFVFSI